MKTSLLKSKKGQQCPFFSLTIKNSIHMNTNNQDLEIAKIIYQQLGGNRFAFMTGTTSVSAVKNGLLLNLIPNKSKAKFLTITLNGLDLYDLKFQKLNSERELETVQEFNNIYNDQLQEIFTRVTGLYTKL
jgi:hypothetical protein